MPLATARVATARPGRYLKQLVSHMGHKATTSLTADGRGSITVASGTCTLTPTPDYLELTATAVDTEALARVQDVIARHLVRFATQEELVVEWSAPLDGGDLEPTAPAVSTYLLGHHTPADELLGELAVATREALGGAAHMQVAADEGTLLTMLTRLTGARFAVEVGVFTGYSSLCIARGLAEGGRLLACDVSEEWTAIGRPFWERAGVADRIDLRIAPALDTLRALADEPAIDLAFIDADKVSYPAYYEEIVRRLRPGGLVVLDNVFLGGRVLDPAYQEEHHLAMRQLNDLIAADERVDAVMLPVRDGVTIARRR
jgi:predicted O-methyltransferase YrrM